MEISRALARHRELVLSIASGECRDERIDHRISESWRRCIREYGLDPTDSPAPVVVAPADLRDLRQRAEPLLSIARVEMTNLYQQIAGGGHAIVLTDETGTVLNYVGDPAIGTTAGLCDGAVWSERTQGTNGMGTCLTEGSPVVIDHYEHFLDRNLSLVCTAAPIFDADNRVVAVLDASSRFGGNRPLTRQLVIMSAQTIENQLFLSAFRDRFVLRFHSRPEFVHTLSEGLIAFGDDGEILGANRHALFQLECDSSARLCGRRVDALFDRTLPGLIRQAGRATATAAPLHDADRARRFHAAVLQPQTTARGVPVAAAADGDGATVGDPRPLDRLSFGDPLMARNVRIARRVRDHDIPVLLIGECGTGKRHFARALHCAGVRAGKPFVAVNCAAIPGDLIENELFGCKAGAFTGAGRRGSVGRIAQADGGTLFLDAIGDLPLALQARLLRVLEDAELVPVGGVTPTRVDVRVVSATPRPLDDRVADGGFREDLFYRLQGVTVELPPVRARSDVRALIEHLLAVETAAGPPVGIEPGLMARLVAYHWPGNLRQVRNVLRTLLVLADSDTLLGEDLLGDLLHEAHPAFATDERGGGDAGDRADATDGAGIARARLLRELERNRWNVSRTAKSLNVSRSTLYRRMRVCRIPLQE